MISVSSLSFSYEKSLILENVSFEVTEGSLVCFVGPNGGGKTTLLRLLLGQLMAGSGKITFNPAEVRRQIGYVPQHFHYDPQFPIQAGEVVGMGCLNQSLNFGRERRERIEKSLEKVGLAGFSKRVFQELSGGQRQRVLIARALAMEPRLLFLDEPTANVDATVKNDILGLLESLKGELTILLVTHDVTIVARFPEHVICVNRRAHKHPLKDGIDEALMRHLIGEELP